jgi:hypothetical protein
MAGIERVTLYRAPSTVADAAAIAAQLRDPEFCPAHAERYG